MTVGIVFFLSCFAITYGSKCDESAPLPKSLPLSDVAKITTWYQTVSSNDPISSQYICGTFARVNVSSESDTFTALLTKYYNKAKPRPFNAYLGRTTDGYFQRFKVDPLEIPTLVTDQYGKWNMAALQEDYRISISPQKNSFIGDGSRYFAYAKCTPQGWAVWVYTPKKVLATEDLLYIHNELVKHGIHTELRLGSCGHIIPECY